MNADVAGALRSSNTMGVLLLPNKPREPLRKNYLTTAKMIKPATTTPAAAKMTAPVLSVVAAVGVPVPPVAPQFVVLGVESST